MNLPFSTEQFFGVFGEYNSTIFPVQLLFYLAAFYSVYLVTKNKKSGPKVISSILVFFWLWMGLMYHIIFFSEINPAAYIFGILFIIQSLLFAYYGIYKNHITFKYEKNIFSNIAWILIVYALFIYPFLGYLVGHQYPYSPQLSAPCPTTIFTFAILLIAERPLKTLLIIPVLWSLLGFSAAIQLNVPQDYGLVISGITVLILSFYKGRRIKIYDQENLSGAH